MYCVKCLNNGQEGLLYDGQDEGLLLASAVVCEGINKTGSFVFAIPATNVQAGQIHELQSEILVEDMDGVELYRGRPVEGNPDLYNTTEYTCEGALAYLLDTKYPPYLHTGPVSLFLKDLLDYHNARVTEKQKIYLGTVTVVDPNDYVRRESEDYDSVLNIIQEKLVATYGGLLQVRRANGKNYLDYLADYPQSDQVARLGENIIDLTQCIKTDTVRTVIIPLGAKDEETGKYLDITSVNGGKNYLVDTELVQKYGWIEDTVEFEDVTLAANLLKKGQDYLEQCRNFEMSIELSMVDCRLIGLDTRRIKPGMMVMVESDFHNLHQYFLCTEKETDLLNPANDTIVLGSQIQTFTESVNKDKKEYTSKMENVKTGLSQEIQAARDEFKEDLENASGLYKTAVKQDDGSTITYYHDKQKLEDSQIQMVFNTAGFGITADGGQNWYGMQVDGDMIANILNASGINAEWIRVGKIRSVDFEDEKSGIEYDLDNSRISSYYYNTFTGHYYRMRIKDSSIEFMDLNENNVFSSMGLYSISINDQTKGWGATLHPSGLQVSKYNNGFVDQGTYIGRDNIRIPTDCVVHLTEYNGNEITNSYTGKTGKAEFSDGSYLTFVNGILTGGKTADGTEF